MMKKSQKPPKQRNRNRSPSWRTVGDKLSRNRVARWMIRRVEIRRERRGRTRRPVGGVVLRSMAWAVHFYTACGLVCAAGIVALLIQNGPWAFPASFGLMLLATAIDATDGTLARRVRIKETLPNFDGRRLDDLVDWLTYTCLPLLLIWRAEILPGNLAAWLVVPLMASAYGFCQTSIKSDDGYFIGFPSLWNVVALYLYMLDLPGSVALAVVLTLSVLTFVPSKYLYPSSRPNLLNTISNIGAFVWSCFLAFLFFRMPPGTQPGHRLPSPLMHNLALASLVYPAYYMGASWFITLRSWFGKRGQRRISPQMTQIYTD